MNSFKHTIPELMTFEYNINNMFAFIEESDTKIILFNDSANNGDDIISQNDLPLTSTINNDIQFEPMNIAKIIKSNDISSKNLDIKNNFILSEYNNSYSNNQILEINEKPEKNYDFSVEHLSQKNIGIKEVRFKTKIINIGSIKTKKRKYSQENRSKSFIKKRHLAKDDDNILRKIQVHYLSFIISFVNDVIKTLFPNKKLPLFKIIDYEIKKIVNHKFVEELKIKTIEEVLQLEVSPKLKNSEKEANQKIYAVIYKKCPEIHSFFKKNYISFFKEYYFKEYYFKDNINLYVNKKIIKISKKTKTFSDLCKKNYCFKEKILKVVFDYYFNCHKRFKKPKFISEKYQV